MRLVLVFPRAGRHVEERRISLRGEGLDVGGAADCDVIVDHPSVGTARVRLERSGEDWVVVDREARGMCAVGGVALRARAPRIVRPPFDIQLGDLTIGVAIDPDLDEGTTREVALRVSAAAAEAAPRRPRVRVVEGARLGETLELHAARPYRIGRAEGCDLFLDEEEASREHLAIAQEGARVVVRDLGSASGTYLGGHRLEPHRGAVWDPARMLRAAGTVFALELATEDVDRRLLASLRPAGDDVDEASGAPSPSTPAGRAPPPHVATSSTVVTSPVADVARVAAPPTSTPRRSWITVAIVACALVVGVAALVLLALILFSG